MVIKTVGELKNFLADLPNDMPIAHYSSNMEKSGYFENLWPLIHPMVKVKRTAYDAFDYDPYDYECYEYNKNGQEVLLF